MGTCFSSSACDTFADVPGARAVTPSRMAPLSDKRGKGDQVQGRRVNGLEEAVMMTSFWRRGQRWDSQRPRPAGQGRRRQWSQAGAQDGERAAGGQLLKQETAGQGTRGTFYLPG